MAFIRGDRYVTNSGFGVKPMIVVLGMYDAGKSTFVMSFAKALQNKFGIGRDKLLYIDTDGKYSEIEKIRDSYSPLSFIPKKDIYVLDAGSAGAPLTADVISRELDDNLPNIHGSVALIAIDTVTSILQPLNASAVLKNLDMGGGKGKGNRSSSFIRKSVVMKNLLSAVNKWGVPTMYIGHYEAYTYNGKVKYRSTLTDAEMERIKKYTNLQITLYTTKGKRYARVDLVGTRPEYEPGSIVIEDTEGWWSDVPEKILEEAFRMSKDEAKRVENDDPLFFSTRDIAVNWALTVEEKAGKNGIIGPYKHADNIYEIVRKWLLDEKGNELRDMNKEDQLRLMADYFKKEIRVRLEGNSLVPNKYRKTVKKD